MKKLLHLLILGACLITVCSSSAIAQDYILGEGDVLTISVYDQPDLTSVVRISGDGMITLPLIGQIHATGQSVDVLSKKVETHLADGYLIHPQVSIFIEEFRNLKATILGSVRSPGLYELEGQTTLLELISKAGGLIENGSHEAIIRRNDSSLDEQEVITVNLNELMEQGQLSRNLAIMNGDNIYIPKKKVFYVTGEVKSPDSYTYEKGLTVIQALTKAGGFSEKAAPNRIKIIRSLDGNEQLLKKVNMDERVQPNDVIVVPESYF
ncbi:MAG: SLBB domain-containing protein [Desulfobacteraceae bacterium]|jgi:polysaccharide export outer membrane protein|nr:SLBB domain-containing protein [Desulfobacteraceae bacterium]